MPTTTYIALANTTLGSTATSVTFSSIPNTYRDLVLVVAGSTTTEVFDPLVLQFNNDQNMNYWHWIMTGDGTSGSVGGGNINYAVVGAMGNSQTNSIVNIMNYSATDRNKMVLGRGNHAGSRVRAGAAVWQNTSAITSIRVRTDANLTFASGSSFALYGIVS